MLIHDDIMPETNNLYKLKKFAKENLAIIPDTSYLVKKLLNLSVISDNADEVMMEWMANFKIPEIDHKSKIDYLKNEKESIIKVRETILNTLYQGKKVIKESDDYIKKNNLREELKTIYSARK